MYLDHNQYNVFCSNDSRLGSLTLFRFVTEHGKICKIDVKCFMFSLFSLYEASQSHSIYNFEGGRFVSCEIVARCHFSNQQVPFHRPFIGGVSVVVLQCYQQFLFNVDPSLISTYFMLRSA